MLPQRLVIPVSRKHQAIANIAFYLERNSVNAFDFMDGGMTLDVQLRERQKWIELEREYISVGGNICSTYDIMTNSALSELISRGVPSDLAKRVLDILEAQNRGELPFPLEAKEQAIVTLAWRLAKGVTGDV